MSTKEELRAEIAENFVSGRYWQKYEGTTFVYVMASCGTAKVVVAQRGQPDAVAEVYNVDNAVAFIWSRLELARAAQRVADAKDAASVCRIGAIAVSIGGSGSMVEVEAWRPSRGAVSIRVAFTREMFDATWRAGLEMLRFAATTGIACAFSHPGLPGVESLRIARVGDVQWTGNVGIVRFEGEVDVAALMVIGRPWVSNGGGAPNINRHDHKDVAAALFQSEMHAAAMPKRTDEWSSVSLPGLSIPPKVDTDALSAAPFTRASVAASVAASLGLRDAGAVYVTDKPGRVTVIVDADVTTAALTAAVLAAKCAAPLGVSVVIKRSQMCALRALAAVFQPQPACQVIDAALARRPADLHARGYLAALATFAERERTTTTVFRVHRLIGILSRAQRQIDTYCREHGRHRPPMSWANTVPAVRELVFHVPMAGDALPAAPVGEGAVRIVRWLCPSLTEDEARVSAADARGLPVAGGELSKVIKARFSEDDFADAARRYLREACA